MWNIRMKRIKTAKEFSCGGVVFHKGKVLIIRMKNLKGEKVWTFPKGHVEHAEKPRETAVREVKEETGYDCGILKPLFKVRYRFKRKNVPVRKCVQWYLMKKGIKTGKPNKKEISGTRWVSLDTARKILVYPGDHKLLDATEKINRKNRG